MIAKQISPSSRQVLVTFEVPSTVWAEQITLVGDFNQWDPKANPLVQTRANENWHLTLTLEADRTYRFRYLVDGKVRSCDFQGDGVAYADDGSPCSIVITRPNVPPRPGVIPSMGQAGTSRMFMRPGSA